MRGGVIHNQVLVPPVMRDFAAKGAVTYQEHPVFLEGRLLGYVDGLATYGTHSIVIEAEMAIDRLGKAIAKAGALNADLLFFVVPSKRVAEAVRRKLQKLSVTKRANGVPVCCLTLGSAIQRLRISSDFMTALNVLRQEYNKYPRAKTRKQAMSNLDGGKS